MVEGPILGENDVLRPAIFLDRDGTLNIDTGYTHRPQDLRLHDHVLPGLQKLVALGFELVIVTNQSGIARGHFDEGQMHAFHQALRDQLATAGISLAGIYHCPFHPEATRECFRQDSPLRKPRPGMLLAAAADLALDLSASVAIGDKKSDIAAGQAAGCRTILVQTGQQGAGEPELNVTPDHVAADLVAAAAWIESAWSGKSNHAQPAVRKI